MKLLAIALLAYGTLLTGCVVHETRPLEKINPVQATQQIPADELLDVGVHVFDPGIPAEIAEDPDALAKRRIYPDLRRAEARFVAASLSDTLETSGQWGAVRTVPDNVQFVDILLTGKIIESTGANLALQVRAVDATGRVLIDDRRYAGDADVGSYKTDAALKARDPFQNVYSRIANDLVAARAGLTAEDRRAIRQVSELRFAEDLAPSALAGYLVTDNNGRRSIARLPAENDPLMQRVRRIRETDATIIDTLDGYYENFDDQLSDAYDSYRRASFEEMEKENRLRNQARTRTFLGAAAVLASVFVPGQCAATDYNCRRIESAARTAGAIGGTAGVLSGLKKYADAKNAAASVRELSESFQGEAASQVVDVEGKTLKLVGSADEQYREWRQLLREMHLEETAGVATAPQSTDDSASNAKGT
ncbi:MAG: hypothetical protein R3E77_15445 [Steroidobacteraceae bacterium]